jgi:hypothetical protein
MPDLKEDPKIYLVWPEKETMENLGKSVWFVFEKFLESRC